MRKTPLVKYKKMNSIKAFWIKKEIEMRRSFLLALPIVLVAAMPAAAQQASTTTTAFDAWVMGCNSRTDKGATTKTCEIRTTIVVQDQQSKQQGVAAVVAIGKAVTDKTMQIVAQLPINAMLNVPVKINGKDDKTIVELSYATCQPQMCNATANLTDAHLSVLKKVGDNFFIVYRNQTGQDVKIEGSTKGFNAALDALLREK